jgi:hypothetical protein
VCPRGDDASIVERPIAVTVTAQEQPGSAGTSLVVGDAIPTARRYLRRNLTLMVGELVCFALGMAFFDASTVLVSFVASLTGSAIILGLMPTIFQIGAGLPQLAMARFLAHRQRKLPYIIWGRFFSNLPLFFLVAVTWVSPHPVVLLVTLLRTLRDRPWRAECGLDGRFRQDLPARSAR